MFRTNRTFKPGRSSTARAPGPFSASGGFQNWGEFQRISRGAATIVGKVEGKKNNSLIILLESILAPL